MWSRLCACLHSFLRKSFYGKAQTRQGILKLVTLWCPCFHQRQNHIGLCYPHNSHKKFVHEELCRLIIHIFVSLPGGDLGNFLIIFLMVELDSDFSVTISVGLSFCCWDKNPHWTWDWNFGSFISRHLKADNMKCSTCPTLISMKTNWKCITSWLWMSGALKLYSDFSMLPSALPNCGREENYVGSHLLCQHIFMIPQKITSYSLCTSCTPAVFFWME